MNRRASLPGADELFRPTGQVTPLRSEAVPEEPDARDAEADRSRGGRVAPPPVGEASGRTAHDQKITVYLTQQELLDLEQARLRLQAEFSIKVDRGRIVREAVAELLSDLHEAGPDAAVVRRLS